MLSLIIAIVLLLVLWYYWNKRAKEQQDAALMALVNQKYPKSCSDQAPCPSGQACMCPPEAKELCQRSGTRCVSLGDVQSKK